ncbi:hypothetical protein [Zestomonas thermotolerans]|uniref:hypothetical protein n=1 Tax=Zestomonas thermotolerans TaxID=157784 RepID=UPI000485701E|nr:hypothetical protein [Pseudomonas thermotolerans]
MPHQQNSRLGQILIGKGLISRDQLDAAIRAQAGSGKRLGEILVAQGVLSERQLARALKKQKNLRLAATLIAALLSPFQMASADLQRLQPGSRSVEAMAPLDEREMRRVSAQGLDDVLQGLFLQAESGDGPPPVLQLAKLVMPVLESLEAETSLQDVRYDIQHADAQLNPDGTLNLRLPSSIGELRFDNIHVAHAPAGQGLGSLHLQDIDLSRASLKISLHH